jgi:PAS domain-containing protein
MVAIDGPPRRRAALLSFNGSVTSESGEDGPDCSGPPRVEPSRLDPPDVAHVIMIPSTDTAFRRYVDGLRGSAFMRSPEALEARLRRVFPRAAVRRRDISGEPAAWYVYRDGGWRPSMIGPWWEQPGLPRVEISREGWIHEANATARDLLGIAESDLGTRHFTDFVAPGGLEDATALFGIVDQGNDLTATALLRPTSGDIIAIDVHAWREDDRLLGVLRLADDVEVSVPSQAEVELPSVVSIPATDAAFRGYVDMALSRMPEPTPDGLALRLRRLYPHAQVSAEGDGWVVRRDRDDEPEAAEAWWTQPDLPRVRYDAEALILEANAAVEAFLGRQIVGHHWQEFVTPGSTEQVSAMLAILAEVGHAESRFRMPRADGSLVEFDSYTEVDAEGFTTIMRPREEAPAGSSKPA